MVITIFKIRLLQFLRLLKEIGLLRIMILVPLCVIVSLIIYGVLASPKNTIMSLIVIGLLLISAHATRKDKHFLKTIIKNLYPIYFSEYLLLTLPVLIIWLINTNWIGIGVLVLIVCITPLLSIKLNVKYLGSIFTLLLNPFRSNQKFRFNVSLPFISTTSFEWRSGIRKNFLILATVYLLFVAFSFKPYIAEVGLILISLFISGFYLYGESREFIELYARNPKEFILKKILTNFRQIIIVFTPILVISLIFQTSTWYYLIGALTVSLIIQAFTIVFKYGLFEENANLNRNIIILLFFSLFALSPYFLPVPFALAIWSYTKAVKNLKPYFND